MLDVKSVGSKGLIRRRKLKGGGKEEVDNGRYL